MAIDDNTVYGLTGAQVKELPERIEAVKGLAKVLTTDDYNWPTDNPTSVALWLLEPGVYSVASGVMTGTSVRFNTQYSGLIMVGNTGNYKNIFAAYGDVVGGYILNAETVIATGEPYSQVTSSVLTESRILDNLTSTSTTRPLSANQGRVLKGFIDAIQVPTKTSDLTNDSDFVTSTEMDTALADKADANDIPTALSELTNDINAVSDANYVHTDNNYTTTEKTKLAGITAGAEANTIDTVKVNGTALAPDANKAVDISVPTAVSELTNDSGFTSNVGTITGVSANGTSVATAGVADIPSATTSRYGVTQLSSSTSSTSTTLAATPSAVRSAYNLANGKATITMSATDPGEGSTLAANNFIAVYGDDPMSYSTSEVDTGSTWVDGDEIYKRSIQITLASGTARTTDISSWNISNVIKTECVIDGKTLPFYADFGSGGVHFATFYIDSNSTVYALSSSSYANLSGYLTIYYTKSS